MPNRHNKENGPVNLVTGINWEMDKVCKEPRESGRREKFVDKVGGQTRHPKLGRLGTIYKHMDNSLTIMGTRRAKTVMTKTTGDPRSIGKKPMLEEHDDPRD